MASSTSRLEVPALRVRPLNQRPWRSKGDHVLYWMVTARRGAHNFALQHAVARAKQLRVPLIVLEALRCDYPWSSARLHSFAIDAMRDNARWLAERGVAHHAFVERERGAGRGLLEALAQRACGVVTDEFPCFFVPRMQSVAAARLECRVDAVDANGLLPLRATASEFPSAYAFRRFLQRNLRAHLSDVPLADAPSAATLARGEVPAAIARRWPALEAELDLAALPFEARVPPVAYRGGAGAARRALREFLERKLIDYDEKRSEPESGASSGLSPYLHFGNVSVHEILHALAEREERWTVERIRDVAHGRKQGWWTMSLPAEAFLDELVTWRELGFVFCAHRPDHARYESLPEWAKATLAKHARDARPHVYSLGQFDAALTHDPLWNAAQTQLRSEGRIHNSMRMLWGKKILEWSPTPQDALATLIELNNRYAVDGRDPNSYSGIFWCLGRFDRPWPERAIYGVVRSMSSASMARKVEVDDYVRRYTRPSSTLYD
jgi:deoxyribodipyrimidine photo-lyase